MDDSKLVLSPKDVRAATGWSMPTVLELFNRDDFPSWKMGTRWAISADAFKAWIEGQAGGVND